LVEEVVNRCWHFRYRHVDQDHRSRFYHEGVGFGMTAQDAANNMCTYLNPSWAQGITIIKASVHYDITAVHMVPTERSGKQWRS
jgi:hypothetical protein